MLGLKRGTVELETHRAEWEQTAADTIVLLKEVLGDAAIDIQHVGSTAIPSIHAKPIIDIAVTLRQRKDIEIYKARLEQEGIIFRKEDVAGQLLFVMGDFETNTRTHHIHVVPRDSAAWRNYINFRDYLNVHPDRAQVYDILKQRLAQQYADDRGSYTAGKQELINTLLEEAERWRGQNLC